MTFQRATALRDRRLVRQLPARRHASWSAATIRASRPEAYDAVAGRRLHRPRRRRADAARAAARAREATATSRRIAGPVLSRTPDGVRPQPRSAGRCRWRRARCGCRTAPPACWAATRCSDGTVDVVETSRGCTYDCSFCSIIEMRGRNFHPYPDRSRAGRHRRRRGARRRSDFPGRRQHHARRRTLRGAVPARSSTRASTTSITSCRR